MSLHIPGRYVNQVRKKKKEQVEWATKRLVETTDTVEELHAAVTDTQEFNSSGASPVAALWEEWQDKAIFKKNTTSYGILATVCQKAREMLSDQLE